MPNFVILTIKILIMGNFNFASFKPILPSLDAKQDEARQYYIDNNIKADNPYMEDFLNLPQTPTITPAQVPNKLIGIKDILSNIKYESTAPKEVNFTVSKTSATTNKKAKDSIDFFVSKGLSKEQSAGIVGNLHAESGLNPSNHSGDSDTAHGLAQWRLDRWQNLQNFAKSRKTNPDDFKTQLEFIWHELNTTHTGALKKLLGTTNVAAAAKAFSDHYERPKKYNNERAVFANTFFKL